MEKLEKPNYRGRREGGGGCLDESLCWIEFFPKCNNRPGAGGAGFGGVGIRMSLPEKSWKIN